MFTFWVIEHFNVIEDNLSGLFTGFVKASTDAFAFEQVEEAFRDGIVMAVSAPAHRMFEIVGAQESGPVAAGVLEKEYERRAKIVKPSPKSVKPNQSEDQK